MSSSNFIVFLFLFLTFQVGNTQSYSIKTYTGASYYLGDLAPYTNNLSFSKGRFVGGLSVTAPIAKNVSLSARVMRGTLEGSDVYAKSYNRLRRNLSFVSPITEFSLTTEVYISEILPFVSRWGVDFYFYTGMSVFKFNPMAFYEGEWVELQPLGTEGQGVVEFGGLTKYKLTQVGIPLGVGLEFNVAKSIKVGFEVAPRLTFTDYLDDVSTDYVDYDRQVELQGEQVANLANRIAEFEQMNNPETFAGQPFVTHYPGYVRGDPTDNDWYVFTNIILTYVIDLKKEEGTIK